MRHIAAVILRIVVLLVVEWGTFFLVGMGHEPIGVDIGAGLMGFLAVIVVSLIWAFVDGRRDGRLGTTLARWAFVALLFGAATPFVSLSVADQHDTATLARGFRELTPFMFGLALVPALVGALVGHALPRRRAGADREA